MTAGDAGERPAVRPTNLDRILWPETGFTKGDMLDYYRRVAPVLLPHLHDRPVALARFPTGIHQKGWYQTNCRAPAWLPTAEVPGRSGELFRMCLIGDTTALEWVINQGTVELHPYLASASLPDRPLVLVFDLDPGPPAGLVECCRVALRVRELLAADGLVGSPKTSGAFGLHVYVGLERGPTFAQTKAYARELARRLVADRPADVIDSFRFAERAGRVLIDWRQNEWARSTIAPYSLRATPWPLVSTPLHWTELEQAADAADARSLYTGPAAALERVARWGDVFGDVVRLRQRLPVWESAKGA